MPSAASRSGFFHYIEREANWLSLCVVLSPAMPTTLDPKVLRPLLHKKLDELPDAELEAAHKALLQLEADRLVGEMGEGNARLIRPSAMLEAVTLAGSLATVARLCQRRCMGEAKATVTINNAMDVAMSRRDLITRTRRSSAFAEALPLPCFVQA